MNFYSNLSFGANAITNDYVTITFFDSISYCKYIDTYQINYQTHRCPLAELHTNHKQLFNSAAICSLV